MSTANNAHDDNIAHHLASQMKMILNNEEPELATKDEHKEILNPQSDLDLSAESDLAVMPETEAVEDDLPSEDEFLSEDDSDKIIRDHNAALDGKGASSESATEDENTGQSESSDIQDGDEQSLKEGDEKEEEALASDPFLGFSSARDFMSSGRSFESVMSGLRKPKHFAGERSSLGEKPVEQAGMVNESNTAYADTPQRVEMNAGRAALMLGGAGLLKLGSLLGKGVSSGANLAFSGAGKIGSGLNRWQVSKAEKELKGSLNSFSEGLNSLRAQGLGQLEDKGVSLDQRQEMAKQFFNRPGNEHLLEELFESAARMKAKARVLLEKSVNSDDSPDAVLDRVLEPMRRLTDQNEQLMASLKLGDETLLERMDNAMNSLFDLMKAMFQKLAETLGMDNSDKSAPSSSNQSPSLG